MVRHHRTPVGVLRHTDVRRAYVGHVDADADRILPPSRAPVSPRGSRWRTRTTALSAGTKCSLLRSNIGPIDRRDNGVLPARRRRSRSSSPRMRARFLTEPIGPGRLESCNRPPTSSLDHRGPIRAIILARVDRCLAVDDDERVGAHRRRPAVSNTVKSSDGAGMIRVEGMMNGTMRTLIVPLPSPA